MRNIQKHEQSVLDAFKSIKVKDKESVEHAVHVIYGTADKADIFLTEIVDEKVVDKIRLPLISLVATEVGTSHILFDGTINTLYRSDMNQIIEQVLHLRDQFESLSVTSVEIGQGDSSKAVQVLKGRFSAYFNDGII